ncbi:hypothetical protein [Methylobacter svalbardensis]|uniref:hypothetical protein n=1 Tax=Methylobacter svalbardensis TaxID=3080016 RepID=UPI0030EE9DC2
MHLSEYSGITVTEERILEIILDDKDNKFTLSAVFPDYAMAIRCREVQYNKVDLDDDIKKRIFPDQLIRNDLLSWQRGQLKMSIIDTCNQDLQLGDDEYVSIAYSNYWEYFDQLEESILKMAIEYIQIDTDRYLIEDAYLDKPLPPGVWDLSMIGSEWIEVNRQYHALLHKANASKIQDGRWTGGVCVKRDGQIYKLQRIRNDVEYPDYLNAGLEKLKQQISGFYVEDYLEESCYKEAERRMKIWSDYFAIEPLKNNKYYPMDYLHEGIMLVVRTDAIKVFEDAFGRKPDQKLSNKQLKELEQLKLLEHSDYLKFLLEASEKFWINSKVIPADWSTHSNNDDVSNWLNRKGLSMRIAVAGATIIRPAWAYVGRKPSKN